MSSNTSTMKTATTGNGTAKNDPSKNNGKFPPGEFAKHLDNKDGEILIPYKQDPKKIKVEEAESEVVQAPLRSAIWPVIYILLHFVEMAFATIVLGLVVADLFTVGPPKTCAFFLELAYPSDGVGIIVPNGVNEPDGISATCEFALGVSASALFVAICGLFDSMFTLMNYNREARSDIFYFLEFATYLAIACLWCATAIWLGIGYVATCNGRCDMSVNSGVFATKSEAIAALVFAWLSMIPWGLEAGLIIRDCFRRRQLRNEVFIRHEND